MPKVKLLNVEHVKRLLDERGMTVKELAAAMGYSVKTVKKYLDGADQRFMSVKFPYYIAEAFKVSFESLLYDEELRVYGE